MLAKVLILPIKAIFMQFTPVQVRQYFDTMLKTVCPSESERQSLANIALQYFTGKSAVAISLHRFEPLGSSITLALMHTAEQLQQGSPIQYVLGEAWFDGLRLSVSPDVLIPRQETEELVEWVAATAASMSSPRIWDIGTGSGCIAIALQKRLPAAEVFASDISEAALHIAQKNAIQHRANVSFVQHDILQFDNMPAFSPVNLVVSNPPYILPEESTCMPPQVLDYEPHLALFVSNGDVLQFYKAVAKWARHYLLAGGAVFFELNEFAGVAIASWLESEGWQQVSLNNDINRKPRMLRAYKSD